MRKVFALLIIPLTIVLTATPAAAFDRPTRPTAPPPGSGPVSQPMSRPPAGMAGMAGETVRPPVLRVLDAAATSPDEFLWQARPVVIFADTPADSHFIAQMKMVEARPASLMDRSAVVITDTDPAAGSEWRQRLHPRGFSLVLIDTDGRVVTRKPLPWDVREISRAIDKLPSRREEIRRFGLIPVVP